MVFCFRSERCDKMVETSIKVLSLVIFVAIIVSADLLFLKDKFWQRLAFNIGVFLVYLAIFLTYLNN